MRMRIRAYISSVIAGFASVAFAFVGGLLSDLALLLEFVLEFPTVNHILGTQLN